MRPWPGGVVLARLSPPDGEDTKRFPRGLDRRARDYAARKLGLSLSRAEWLAAWCDSTVEAGRLPLGDFLSGLGRLGFGAMLLRWEKPLLGPICAWAGACALRGRRVVSVPWAIHLLLTWLGRRLREGERLQSPLRIGPATIEVFRSDARAEDGRAWVGGWEVPPSGAARDARWFAAELDRKCCPWVWAKAREPNRAIAALELLGTLLCPK